MKLQKNNLLIKQLDPINQSKHGIYVPDSLLEKRNRGIVTHIGTNVDPDLLGKEVLFQLPAAQDFNYENITGKLLFTTDIIATLN
jgi:co-chaperonin GroES (HSP10)